MVAAARLAFRQINNKTDRMFDDLLPRHEVSLFGVEASVNMNHCVVCVNVCECVCVCVFMCVCL